MERLTKLQKKSIRIICRKSYNHHTEPLYKQLKLLTVKDQHHLNCATFMHQLKMGTQPKSFDNLKLKYFTTPVRCTRQSQTVVANEQLARTKFSALLPYHKFPQIWNSIENRFREIKSTRKFRKYHLGQISLEIMLNKLHATIRDAPNVIQHKLYPKQNTNIVWM